MAADAKPRDETTIAEADAVVVGVVAEDVDVDVVEEEATKTEARDPSMPI